MSGKALSIGLHHTRDARDTCQQKRKEAALVHRMHWIETDLEENGYAEGVRGRA